MQIAVTGGNGDLGRVLVPYLAEQGHHVVSIDRTLPNPTHIPAAASYQVADARDFGETVSALHGCEAVIHLAAHRHPKSNPAYVVHNENVAMSYNVLSAAATLGLKRVCLASSINAIGGAFSRAPRYDYFPLDEGHPTYAEDPYSLSKWLGEQQADAFVRRYEQLTVASLRFHGLVHSAEKSAQWPSEVMTRHLWAYTLLREAARACLLALTAPFTGHEVFYIVAPQTRQIQPSRQLAEKYYPNTPIRGEFAGNAGFFDCRKAERILGWVHQE